MCGDKKNLVTKGSSVPMRVIFLDIDGCLNCSYTKEKLEGYIFVMDSKVELLKEIVDRTGAKIVLSSDWRLGWFDHEAGINNRNVRMFLALRDKLEEHGLELFDKTPDFSYNQRGEEIDAWLKSWQGEPIDSFVCIDDMNGRWLRPHADRLVRTSFAKGMLPKHVELAVKILNKPIERV